MWFREVLLLEEWHVVVCRVVLYFQFSSKRCGLYIAIFAMTEVMWLGCFVCLFVCLSYSNFLFVCEDYCKFKHPISLKVGVMIGPTNEKNWLTSGGDPIPDMDSGSLFHLPYRCRVGDFRRFISSSHTVTGRFSRHSDADKVVNPHFWCDLQTFGSESGLIQKFGFQSRITLGWG